MRKALEVWLHPGIGGWSECPNGCGCSCEPRAKRFRAVLPLRKKGRRKG